MDMKDLQAAQTLLQRINDIDASMTKFTGEPHEGAEFLRVFVDLGGAAFEIESEKSAEIAVLLHPFIAGERARLAAKLLDLGVDPPSLPC